MEQNSTKLDRKQNLNVLYQVYVFRADRKNKIASPASDCLRQFPLLLWKHWTEFNETWQEARSLHPLPSLCFSGRSEKQDGRPGLWLAETFSTSPLRPLNGIQRNLTGSKISTSSTKFVFYGPLEEQDGRPGLWLSEQFWLLLWNRWTEFNETWQVAGSKRPLSSFCFVFLGRSKKQDGCPLPIGWDIFYISETADWNSTKLDRKQDLNILYKVWVFLVDQKDKMAAPVSDWLQHFGLLLWNRWMKFNKTWQEAIFQRPLPSLCFFRSVSKQKWPRWPICQKRCTLYSGARYVALWASCSFVSVQRVIIGFPI